MITWQKVIDVSEISGTPDASTGAGTNIVYLGDFDEVTASETYSSASGWFVGSSEGQDGSTFNGNIGDVLESAIRTDNFTGDFPFGAFFVTRGETIELSGSTTFNSYGFDLTIDDGNEFTVNGPSFSQDVAEDNQWSFYAVNLRSYELTTLSNQSGTTTTETTAQSSFLSTSGNPATTFFQPAEVSITRTTIVNTLTRQTWTDTSIYQTTVLTGQTTAIAYLSFGNSAPLLIVNSEANTVSSTISPLSFQPQNPADSGNTIFTKTFIDQGNAIEASRTVTSQGSIVSGIFPSVVAFGQKISSGTIGQNTTSTGEEVIADTISLTASKSSSGTEISHLPFAGALMSFGKTFSVSVSDIDPFGYISYIDNGTEFIGSPEADTVQNSEAPQLVGGPRITKISQFDYGQVSIAHSISVFVAGVSDGLKGASFPLLASNNIFHTHTVLGAIPASRIIENPSVSITYFANSYTSKSGNNQTESFFDVLGDSTSQWTLHNTQVFKVLGGPLKGDAFIHYGVFETYCGTDSSTISSAAATVTTWSAGQETTAFLGRDVWTSESDGTVDVSNLPRWNITSQPLDD